MRGLTAQCWKERRNWFRFWKKRYKRFRFQQAGSGRGGGEKIARERQTKAALKVASTIKEVDMNNLTPLLAFDLVNELSKQIKESYE